MGLTECPWSAPGGSGMCVFLQQWWPQGLVRPGAGNWGDWDTGAATEQTKCLSPATGGMHIAHMYTCTYVFLTNRPSP